MEKSKAMSDSPSKPDGKAQHLLQATTMKGHMVELESLVYFSTAVNTPTVLQNRISDALWQYVADCPIGGMVSITRISEIAYRTTAFIANISQVTLNGQAQDITSPANGSFHLTGVTFT